ncbi:MAG: hypothetical protein PHQ18_04815 [Patescibacteria group bacterium]|nr:hypothetical protein [Patescibacteria group bacterium]
MPQRNWETTRFKKTVAITKEDYEYLVSTKIKKTIAGRLESIINYFRQNHPEEESNKE